MGEDWPEDTLNALALRYVAAQTAEEKIRHSCREQLGDPSLREKCCGTRRIRFHDDRSMQQISELAGLVKLTSVTGLGWEKWYCCEVCGQEWIESQTEYGKCHVPIVFKAP